MSDYLIYILAGFAATVVILLGGYINLLKRIKLIEQANVNQNMLLNNQQDSESRLYQLVKELENNLQSLTLENQQVTDQLAIRTKNLQQHYVELKADIETLRHEQPEDRLYRRALKMVELGADIEEVMNECELPRAEAELLFSVHIKST